MLAKEQTTSLAPVPDVPAPVRTGPLRFVPSLYQVATLAVLGAVLIAALGPRLDTDFWWHLKVGQYIWTQHTVPSRDFMSYTFAGHPWTDHEWLAELLLYGLYRLAGLWGLWGPIVFFAAVICATYTLVYAHMASHGVNRILALFVLCAAFVASSASWGPRIQMLTMCFLALFGLLLSRYQLSRSRRLLVLFPALMLLWTNLHGGFVLGLVVMALTLIGETLNRFTGQQETLSREDIKALLISFGATCAVTVLNPNGVRQLLYPLTFVLPNAFTNQIEESASPNFHMPVMMVFEAMLLLLVAAAFVRRPRLNWTQLLFVLVFTHLAFSQVRNVPLWSVLISPLLALYLGQTGPALRQMFPRFSYRRRPVRGKVGPALNLALLVLAVVAYLGVAGHYISGKALHKAEADNFPVGAVAYMNAHPLPSHVFVTYGWGGYILWHGFPHYRTFMDSRADTLYTASILNAYLTAYSGSPGWQGVLKKYSVQDVLIEPDAPLAQLLARDRSWRLRYHDGVSVLYSRQ